MSVTSSRKTLAPAAVRKPSVSGGSSLGCSQMAGLYDLEETLGKGHYAVVKAARHVFTGEKVAVKVIDKSKLDANHQKALLKEVLCMKLVQHPHVVRLYEVIDTSSKLYLVLELGHGDLYDLIQKQPGGLPDDVARRYFSQILSAVSYCHKLHVVHRDLKPENVVYFPTDGGLVKLTDFGFSNNYCPGVKLDTSCGSLAYSAPEILLGDAYDAPAVDIWSLGVILFMLVAGRAPFQEANDSETLTMIMDVKYSVPPNVSAPCRELIKSMLIRGPEKRATLPMIESSRWIQEGTYGAQTSQTPLITDHRLTTDEKNLIIGQMEGGRIATREQITEALQTNAYNHITSTFFLLAEKFLRERGDQVGTSSALTSSLESLHDRRKNSGGAHSHSGNSDTDEGLQSEAETDSLAPLDLDMKNASASTSMAVKKSGRIHTTLSSSALADLDKGLQLPVLEENEDFTSSRGEEDDDAGPLPLASLPPSATHSRRTGTRQQPYHHRRVIIPQRSASCSSSEDEDSEKKKRASNNRNKAKAKHGGGCVTGSSSSSGKKKFDDESSDEQGNGNLQPNQQSVTEPFGPSASSVQYKHQSGKTDTTNTTTGKKNSQSILSDKFDSIVTITATPPSENSPPTRNSRDICDHILDLNSYEVLDVPDDDDFQYLRPSSTHNNHSHQNGGLKGSKSNGYIHSDPDRHSCSDLAYAIEVEVPNGLSDGSCGGASNGLPNSNSSTTNTNSSSPTSAGGGGGGPLSLAKKGKRLLFNWFFLKKSSKSSKSNTNNSLGLVDSSNSLLSPSTSVGIYKTKSFAELKLRSTTTSSSSTSTANNPPSSKTVNNSSHHSKSPSSMDVNMNL